MGRRKSATPSSSLDLFLDTICNAFGGIMFLSILISVLLQFRGEESKVDAEQPVISEEESLQIASHLEKLQSERAGLAVTIAELEKSVVGEDRTEILELQARQLQSEAQRDKAVKQQVELSQHFRDVEKRVLEMREELSELDEKLVEARASLAEKSRATEDALDSREQKTELPKVRSTSKGNLIFAMRYGKLYLISNPSGGGFNTNHVVTLNLLGTTRIKPRPNAGWDLSSSADIAEFEQSVCSSSPSDTFFSCAVWPDSHEQFGALKEILLRLGYDYQLLPIDDVDDLSIGKGGEGKVQ
jgi:hypothetical protein